MAAALECCRRLHQMGELDDQLQPVGKESMKLDDHLCAPPADDQVPEGMPRPGTTKRRQYYYKKVRQNVVTWYCIACSKEYSFQQTISFLSYDSYSYVDVKIDVYHIATLPYLIYLVYQGISKFEKESSAKS